jgi:uncharacterized protein YjdB
MYARRLQLVCVILFLALIGVSLTTCRNPLSQNQGASEEVPPVSESAIISSQPLTALPDSYVGDGVVAVVRSSSTTPLSFEELYESVGAVWSVAVDGQDSVDFHEDVATLRFQYEPAAVSGAGYLEEFVVFVSDNGTDWERVERTLVESDGDKWFVLAETSHFSEFVVAAAPEPSTSSVEPASGMDELFPDGIDGTGGAVFTIMDEGFHYYQDRNYTIVPADQSTVNQTTFAELGLDGSIGISTFNGGPTGEPVSEHKHNSGLDYIRFEAHQNLDVYVLYDTRGGDGADDRSEDAEWLRSGWTATGHFLETTDPVGLYAVYKRSYFEGQIIRLDGNWFGTDVDTTRIQTNYWAIIKPLGVTEADTSSDVTNTTEVTGVAVDADKNVLEQFDTTFVRATLEPDDNANADLFWNTSNSLVVAIGDVLLDSEGVWIHSLYAGTAEIWAETSSGVQSDRVEIRVEDRRPSETDSDGDTIPDADEVVGDTDGDGDLDKYDSDDDNDGVPTFEEVRGGLIDTDWNGIEDYRDEDDDGDGILTRDELRDVLDSTPRFAGSFDNDSDGTPNWLDVDSDNDGVDDAEEQYPLGFGPKRDDRDGDGIPNYLDQDDDGDGIPTVIETAYANDPDMDNQPTYLDKDSDGDTLLDLLETRDSDSDLQIDLAPYGVDQNQNGIDDAFDPDLGVVFPSILDFDGDGSPDFTDEDDDNDGIDTSEEAGEDKNSDGMSDHLDRFN